MGFARAGREDVSRRPRAGRRIQARCLSQAGNLSCRKWQAAHSPGRSAYRRSCVRHCIAAGESAGDRSQRHRGDRRSAARARSCRRRGGGDHRHKRPVVMAQLTDDCFAFSGPLLRLDDMERLIDERIAPVAETEIVSLPGARGRVVAIDVKAPVGLPPFDNPAVDGYAVRHADLRADDDTKLTIAGRLTAGAKTAAALKPGEAIRIFTGAAMPKGADT